MAEPPDRSTHIAGLTSAKPPPGSRRYALPIVLGLVLGTGAFAGYLFWSHGVGQHAAEMAGDPDKAKPSAGECAIARAVLAAIHASSDDTRWRTGVGTTTMTLKAGSQVINPADVSGYGDDEADDFRSKAAADWRWCPGMGVFVRGLGWGAMSDEADTPELSLGRPGMNAAGDEAKVYEAFMAPQAGAGAQMLKRGPWLATLHPGPGGAWQVAETTDLTRAKP